MSTPNVEEIDLDAAIAGGRVNKHQTQLLNKLRWKNPVHPAFSQQLESWLIFNLPRQRCAKRCGLLIKTKLGQHTNCGPHADAKNFIAANDDVDAALALRTITITIPAEESELNNHVGAEVTARLAATFVSY